MIRIFPFFAVVELEVRGSCDCRICRFFAPDTARGAAARAGAGSRVRRDHLAPAHGTLCTQSQHRTTLATLCSRTGTVALRLRCRKSSLTAHESRH